MSENQRAVRYPERSNVRFQGEWWLVKEAVLASETNHPEKTNDYNLYVLTQSNRGWKIYPRIVFEWELYPENPTRREVLAEMANISQEIGNYE